MAKRLSDRDIVSILKLFGVADQADDSSQVTNFKQLDVTRQRFNFEFNNRNFSLLCDNEMDDDLDGIIARLNPNNYEHQIHTNSFDSSTYAVPYRKNAYYLIEFLHGGNRLDSLLANKYESISRSLWQKYIKKGYVKVNHTVVKSPKYQVRDDDEIEVTHVDKPSVSNMKFDIIYQDDDVIAINKPSGILSHAKGALSDEFTVADFFKSYTNYNVNTNRPGIVHRLDRDTSGIMIGAKTESAAKILQKQFASHTMQKTYYAILDGHLREKTAVIDLPIARNPANMSRFYVNAKGKSATTRYRIISENDKYSMVKLMPRTGRTHQLRVHMKYLGAPILGDRFYGKSNKRLYLHAYSLEINLPNGNKENLRAPLPTEFEKLFPDVKL